MGSNLQLMDFDPPSADVELGDVRKVECQIQSRLLRNVKQKQGRLVLPFDQIKCVTR